MQNSLKHYKSRQNTIRPLSLSPMLGLSSLTHISNTSLPLDHQNNSYMLPKYTKLHLSSPQPKVEEQKSSVLQKLEHLEQLHKSDKAQIEQLERQVKVLTDQLESMKQANKSLLDEKGFSSSDLHSLYQNLFVTDMKQQMVDMNSDMSKFRSEKVLIKKEYESIKKENVQLQASIKRYRAMIVKGIKKEGKNEIVEDGSSVMSGLISENDKPYGRLESERKKGSEFSLHPARGSHVNYLTISRIEKLNLVLLQLSNCTNMTQLCKILTRAAKSLTKSQKVSIYIVADKAKDLYAKSHSGSSDFIGKVRIANTWVLMHTHKDAYQEEPQFKKLEDLKYPIRQAETLILPIVHNREIHFIIQAQEKKSSLNKHSVYLPTDELLLKIVSNAVSLKIESIYSQDQEKLETLHSNQLVSVATKIISCLSHKDIANKIRAVLPEYFDFENAGIVFIDNKTHQFYVMVHDSSSDGYFGEGCLKFPFGIGLTGQAISREGVSVFKNPKISAVYNPEIDNVGWTHETKCIVMGCLKDWNGNLIGIVQLTNKKNGEVEVKDVKRLEMLLEMLGTCVAAANLSVEQLSLTIQLKMGVEKILGIFGEGEGIGGLDGELGMVVNQITSLRNAFGDWFKNRKSKM